ncbi:TetR/AcrR family transcriptional regulator [Kineococcus gynurae]|uniref:TetR/AcrR family transcriptional regulator n=1 Tax=Kineococcus gynurae TaxID=452979 RepID=A0ABV5LN61_9ACTN
MARPKNPLLSRELVLEQALALLDETGQLTLPGLARRLGVSPSSIYHHVPGGKEEIVEGVRGVLTGSDPGPDPTLPWGEYVEAWARQYRSAMAAHPHVVPLLTAQTVSNPLTLAWYEECAQVLARDGFAPVDVLHAITVLDSLVLGSALDAGAPLTVWADDDEHAPTLSAAIRAGRETAGDRSRLSFELGLRSLLVGLAERCQPVG